MPQMISFCLSLSNIDATYGNLNLKTFKENPFFLPVIPSSLKNSFITSVYQWDFP